MTDNPQRQSLDVDIVCVGFGPAAGGFLTTLTRHLPLPDGSMLWVEITAKDGTTSVISFALGG